MLFPISAKNVTSTAFSSVLLRRKSIGSMRFLPIKNLLLLKDTPDLPLVNLPLTLLSASLSLLKTKNLGNVARLYVTSVLQGSTVFLC